MTNKHHYRNNIDNNTRLESMTMPNNTCFNRPSRTGIGFTMLLVSTILVTSGATAQTTVTEKNETSETNEAHAVSEKLTKKLSQICRKRDVPALAAAAVNKDGVIEMACFGARKRDGDDQVVMSDRFPLASNTKSMTAAVAAVMVEEGKIAWDTTISEVWPDATEKEIHRDFQDVTLNDLLSHQSGLQKDLGGAAWGSFFLESQSPDLERKRMLKLVLPKAPARKRTKFHYSNLGYATVAAMLETRAKEPFESLAKRALFDPLKMESAGFHSLKTAGKMKPPFLWLHDAQGKPVDPRLSGAENPTAYAASGTVQMTIADYAKYAHWQIKGVPGPVLKTQSAFDHLRQPLADFDASGTKYACGWIRFKSGFGTALQHAGSNTNSFALIWVLPDSDVTAIACSNTGEPQAFAACDEAIAHLLLAHRARKK